MIVNGNKIAEEILDKIKNQLAVQKYQPSLGVVLVGKNSISQFYVNKKKQICQKVGFGCQLFILPRDITQEELDQEIVRIQQKEGIDGLIIQLPLPLQINTDQTLNLIDETKDVDCLTKVNNDKLMTDPFLLPPTAAAILEILNYYNIELKDKKIVMVGHGRLVGQPTSILLQQMSDNVETIISVEDNLELLLQADVVITGVGKPRIIKPEMLKDGVVIVDAGVSVVGGSSVGDVDFDGLKDKASLITPAIGGVGPVTIAKLLENVMKAAALKI